MSKHFFEFKQFRIDQEHCAMKVSTDACIQGAWTPISGSIQTILDIGTGTGLLSLMLAQRSPDSLIDAIEIEESAAQQAAGNILASAFSDHIRVHHTDALLWEGSKKYDLIICNPPFFSGSLKGPDAQRNLARHTGSLNFASLAACIAGHLATNGTASVLLPVSERDKWQNELVQQGLNLVRTLWIKPFAQNDANRVVLVCSLENNTPTEETLVIYREQKQYTDQFTDLLRPYYLNL